MSDQIKEAGKKAGQTYVEAGMGKYPVEASHPIHPATVHWPIALLTTSFTLDAFQHFAPSVFPAGSSSVGLLSRVLPPAGVVSQISHFANAGGILFSTISIATGVSELMGMWQGQAQQKGGYLPALKDAFAGSKEDVAAVKLKTTFTHATMNDAVVGIAAYNFWKRATSASLALPRLNAYLSAGVALPLLLYSAYLGGSLVYELGVGVQRQGEGKEYKELQEKKSS